MLQREPEWNRQPHLFKSLQQVAARHGEGDVYVVHYEERLLLALVWETSKVVCDKQQHVDLRFLLKEQIKANHAIKQLLLFFHQFVSKCVRTKRRPFQHCGWGQFEDLLTALSSNSFRSEMRKALRCCLFPLIILKRWEQSAECVSSCRKPRMIVRREELMDCCKLYDIFIPATAFICTNKNMQITNCFKPSKYSR